MKISKKLPTLNYFHEKTKMAVNEKVLHFTIFGFNMAILIRLMLVGFLTPEHSNPLFNVYKRFNMRFLTKWTFVMLFIYYTCMVLVHLGTLNSKTINKLRRFADSLFTIIVVPVGLFITTVFWTIYNIDRNLIFPSWMDEVIPPWINHGIHTFNSALPLVDLFLVKHTFTPWADTIFYSTLYLGSYIVCLFGTYFQHGLWLYPIFTKMTFLQSVLFCLCGYMTLYIFHYITRFIGLRLGKSVMEPHQVEKNNYSNKIS